MKRVSKSAKNKLKAIASHTYVSSQQSLHPSLNPQLKKPKKNQIQKCTDSLNNSYIPITGDRPPPLHQKIKKSKK